MGVRIDISMIAAKKGGASVGVVAPKKAAAGAKAKDEGTGEDFGQTLAKVQPKKKAAVTEQAAAPAKATPVAKGAAKKQVKGKAKDEVEDEGQAPVQKQGGEQAPMKAEDGDVPTADDAVEGVEAIVAGDREDGGDENPQGAELQAAAVIEPTQAVVDPTSAAVVGQAAVPQQQVVKQPETKNAPTEGTPRAVAGIAAPVAKKPAAAEAVRPTKSADADAQPKDDQNEVTQRADSDRAPDVREQKVASQSAEGVETKAAVRHVDRGQGEDAGQQADGGEVREVVAKAPVAKASPVERFNEVFQSVVDRVVPADADKGVEKTLAPADTTDAGLTAVLNDSGAAKAGEAKQVQAAPPVPVAPEARFAEVNHPKVVTAVKTQLLPGGGAMQLRLDPPVLGPLRLEVRMEDGGMTASFVTANDQATSLLTHSLGQLKHALEGAGISVDKLQVRQGSAESFSENSDPRQQGGASDQSSARQEQQRREMLNRMWQKVAGGDPLDLVA